MIRNYILIAFRNIRRNINYTAINISGLALGMTCCMILFLMIRFLTSFDNYHTNKDSVYRVVASSFDNNGVQGYNAGVPVPLPEAIRSEITGIKDVLFISSHGRGGGLVTVEENGERRIFEEEEGFTYTDSLFFDFFDRQLIAGSSALANPNEVVISQKLAEKYFGTASPVGRIVRLDNTIDLNITGVMEDYPDNTVFPFDLIISYATVKAEMDKLGWSSVYSNDECYVMLMPGTKPDDINRQFLDFVKKYEKEERNEVRRWLQPLSDIPHDTRFSNFGYHKIEVETLWAMGIVAVFLIVTACINFVNLTTAISINRSREVAIRKVLGSQRVQLMLQHLFETGLIAMVALCISIGLAELGLIQLNAFIDLNLHIDLSDHKFVLFLFTVWSIVTLTAGLYPAFLLSGFSPAQALKNKLSSASTGGFMLRRTLVVFQFVIAQFFIVGTIVILSQMNYLNKKDLGFQKEAIISVPLPDAKQINQKTALRGEVEKLPGVEGATLCSTPPSSNSTFKASYKLDGVKEEFDAQMKVADSKYLDLFGLKIIAGRGLGEGDTATGFLVSEKLVSSVGLENPEDILGRNIELGSMNLPVVGVVKDFHTVSLAREINPIIIFNELSSYQTLSVRLMPGSYSEAIDNIRNVWSKQYPDFLFNYVFLDEQIARFYDGTRKMSTLLAIASVIAILISCLGLYGLISFMAAEKVKEIGIRKVLGATVQQIIVIFSKEFTVLIVVAFAIAAPMAGYIMNKWLQNFEYKVPLHWLMFAAGMVMTLVIAFITVGYRSIKAATANPVDALRSE